MNQNLRIYRVFQDEIILEQAFHGTHTVDIHAETWPHLIHHTENESNCHVKYSVLMFLDPNFNTFFASLFAPIIQLSCMD